MKKRKDREKGNVRKERDESKVGIGNGCDRERGGGVGK